MANKKTPKTDEPVEPVVLVHLYPTPDFHIEGVPAAECDVTPDEAERLLAYYPPAFTTEPPFRPDPPELTADEGSAEPGESA